MNYEIGEVLKNTDWKMFANQKDDLNHLIHLEDYSPVVLESSRRESLEGILHFLDAIQDAAADWLGHDVVYGKKNEDLTISVERWIEDYNKLSDEDLATAVQEFQHEDVNEYGRTRWSREEVYSEMKKQNEMKL